MKHGRHLSILFFLGSVSAPAFSAEETLGRLFLTPERRAVLEQQRQYNLQEQKSLEGASVRLDGVIVRSSGRKTVWINGHSQNDNNSDFGVSASVAPGNAAQAGLSTGGDAQTRLRVGQQINRATREISDGLDGGRLEVKPPPQPR
jgi:hypothetical protein